MSKNKALKTQHETNVKKNTASYKIYRKFNLNLESNDPDSRDLISYTDDYYERLKSKIDSLYISLNQNENVINHNLFNQIAESHLNLARMFDIRNNQEEASSQRNLAIRQLNAAIDILEKDLYEISVFKTADNHLNTEIGFKDLSKYFSNKAKALRYLDRNTEAEEFCNKALQNDNFNGLAHETLGHIYRGKGEYIKALHHFEQSLQDDSYKKAHKVICLYNKAITFAAMGDKDMAIEIFNKANSKLYKHLEFEDQMLINEMHKPHYITLLQKFAEIADSRQKIINDIDEDVVKNSAEALAPGTIHQITNETKDQINTTLQNIKEENNKLKESRYSDEKLPEIVRSISISTVDKSREIEIIKSDKYMNFLYKKIRSDLNANYSAAQAISTNRVQGEDIGKIGIIGNIFSYGKDLLPGPAKLGATIISHVLKTIDQEVQMEKIQNFKSIVTDNNEMSNLSEMIARGLIMQKIKLSSKSNIEELYDSLSNAKTDIYNASPLKSKSYKKELQKNAEAEGEAIAARIIEIIFDGRVPSDNDSLSEKSNFIIGVMLLDNQSIISTDDEIPDDIFSFSGNVLKGIRAHHEAEKYVWKTKPELELKFTEYLAISVTNKAKEAVGNNVFSSELVNILSKNDNVIIIESRTLKFWEKKAHLNEVFLSSKEYFHPHVEKAAILIANYQYTNTSSSDEEKIENADVILHLTNNSEEEKLEEPINSLNDLENVKITGDTDSSNDSI